MDKLSHIPLGRITGKSTLTDLLIAGFLNRGERLGHFRDRLAIRRVEKLRESRVTKSALPGTTLQNIRVPCFCDHHQALWDTPGLLLDVSLAHFPIRNFREIRAQRPNQIEPQIMEVPKKSFCLLIFEKGDDLPLLRIEVRTKKGTEEDGPVHLVWNSTLDLDTKILDIQEAHEAEHGRVTAMRQNRPIDDETRPEQELPVNEPSRPRTEEERKKRKEEKRLAYLERIKKEQEEIGKAEWNHRRAEEKEKYMDEERTKILAKLTEVKQVIVEAGVGMDIAIANFGWIGFLSQRTAMVKAFAPNSGILVVCRRTLALPSAFGAYKRPPRTAKGGKRRSRDDSDEEDDSDDEYSVEDYDSSYSPYDGFNDDNYDEYSNLFGFGSDLVEEEEENPKLQRWYRREEFAAKDENKDDPWFPYSGKYVGWQFDADARFFKNAVRIEGWVRQKWSRTICPSPCGSHFGAPRSDGPRPCSFSRYYCCFFCIEILRIQFLRLQMRLSRATMTTISSHGVRSVSV